MVRFQIIGTMPERAILRLKRAGIALYGVRKPQKNCIRFSTKKRDSEKVFAIYPALCYNKNGYSPFYAQKIGETGVSAWIERIKKRVGVVLGALLFLTVTLSAQNLVLGIRFTGTQVYAREARAVLDQQGVAPFKRYKGVQTDTACAKLLSLPGVEYCSIQKKGVFVYVEMRLARFSKPTREKGDMCASRTGRIQSLIVLQGTPLKGVGEQVTAGERLVGAYIQTQSGKEQKSYVVARACIWCEYEGIFPADDKESAFAKAYMHLRLSDTEQIISHSVTQTDAGYCVRVEYQTVQTTNL